MQPQKTLPDRNPVTQRRPIITMMTLTQNESHKENTNETEHSPDYQDLQGVRCFCVEWNSLKNPQETGSHKKHQHDLQNEGTIHDKSHHLQHDPCQETSKCETCKQTWQNNTEGRNSNQESQQTPHGQPNKTESPSKKSSDADSRGLEVRP